jgi:lipopolysaccharide/colanic/teichoic acid biosynthesis glycosyltransferase
LRARAVELGVVGGDKAVVLRKGSGGVDVRRFSAGRRASVETGALRARLGIASDAPVVGFVGRFVRDKGIRQLVEAFERLRRERPGLRLLLVGDFEEGDPIEQEARRAIEASGAMVRTGFVADTAPYYALMDVLALPTFREGFPGVPLEAQASGVPVVTTTATGAVDSVVDDETGLLVPVGDSGALAGAIARLLDDPQLRLRMGQAGRERMERDFCPEVIWDAQVQMYRELMECKMSGQHLPAGSWTKRAFDFLVAGIGLLLLLPILVLTAIIVRIFLGSPVFFRQERPGINGALFTLLKFRTLTDARDGDGNLLPDAERMTSLGRFLRSSSLDELPELMNVIRGEMSLVGPRPLLAKYLKRYSAEQMRRHEVKPGITGWAQIHGRNALNWEERFRMDVWYVGHRGFWLDVRILALTLWKIIKREGISQHGHATMPEFRGVEHSGGAITQWPPPPVVNRSN